MPDRLDILGEIFAPTPCLTADELFLYVDNQLAGRELHRVEKHILDCALCSEAVESLTLQMDRATLKARAASLSEAVRQHHITAPFRMPRSAIYFAIAAVLVMGILSVLSVFNRSPRSEERMFAAYYKPYPNNIPLLRGEGTDSLLQSAMSAYEIKDYDNATRLLQALLAGGQENVAARFYLGNALLSLDQPALAVKHFQQVLLREDSKLQEQAEWYMALAYLKMKEPDRAKSILAEVKAKRGIYMKQSTELLGRLNQ